MLINFLIWILVGGLIGWLASLLVGTSARQGVLLNIIVGVLGAFVAGLVLTPIFGVPTINEGNFSFGSVMMSLLGSILLIAAVNILRRVALR